MAAYRQWGHEQARWRQRWMAGSKSAEEEAFASPYLAPSFDSDQLASPEQAFETAGQGVGPRRYVGKSSATRRQPAPQPGPTEPRPRRAARKTRSTEPAQHIRTSTHLLAAPWSLRLIVAVSLIVGLALSIRLLGLFTPPLGSPTGAEATQAAFANAASGRVAGLLDPVRLFPPPAPWYGYAPVDPASGLPLYTWIVALGSSLAGHLDLLGRLVAMLFSAIAGIGLFGAVRRSAGTRAGLYALLLFTIAPLSVIAGQQFSPGSLLLASQAWAVLSLVQWRGTVSSAARGGSTFAFTLALATACFVGLLDPGGLFLLAPAAYVLLEPGSASMEQIPARRWQTRQNDWRDAWEQSPNRGKFVGYAGALVGASLVWWLFNSGSGGALALAPGDGGGGLQAALGALFNAGTYLGIVGLMVERVLTVMGLLLVVAGLLNGGRPPLQMLFHAWLLGGLAHVLVDASRLARHDDVLLPLLLPVCALAGIGAAWAGSLPARIWLALSEQRRDPDAEYAISPHTSWLLDLPEEKASNERPSRPQAQIALGKSIAQRTFRAGLRARRTWFMALGHMAVLAAFLVIGLSSWKTTYAHLQPSQMALDLQSIGSDIAAATPEGSRLIIAGPSAPELFYTSSRTGWALSEDEFSIVKVEELQRAGAAFLLSTDQDWLGHHPDYVGLLPNYSVKKLTRSYILFDLNTKPSANDRLYFLESGHTLGGEFRRFWESHGSVGKLGYPISEEVEETNPLDGQVRTIQYFERAVLEYHPEFAGTPNSVQLAAVGRWVTVGRVFQPVAPFKNTLDRWYFAETGHSVKEAFLKFWQSQGGVAIFGYPISEELPEISSADGKVYTVQYFERARFEWHPSDAGTPDEVQLGLIGKQAMEMQK